VHPQFLPNPKMHRNTEPLAYPAARRGGRMLSELAPAMTMPLSLIPCIKFSFPLSRFFGVSLR
jgi:hypothetical protein